MGRMEGQEERKKRKDGRVEGREGGKEKKGMDFTFYALRFTFHVSRFTFHVSRNTQYAICNRRIPWNSD